MKTSLTPIGDQMLELLSTSVVLLERDRTVCYLNAAAEGLLQISARQAIGIELARLMPSLVTLERGIELALERQGTYTQREHRVVVGSGHTVTVNCAITPLAHGRILLELDQLDHHLRISRENQLIAQNRAIRELIRNLAHEIKNPLGGLRGAAQLLQQELLEPSQHEYTEVIIREADRLRALVDGLLGPDTRGRYRPTNIHQLLEHVRHLVQAEAPPRVSIVRDYDPSIPPLQVVPDQLIQVLLNLVRNALQAVGDTGLITLYTRTQRRFTIGNVEHRLVACIKVIDDGCGIPVERQDTIFYPVASDHAPGRGIGLSIAQTLLYQHGGLIECTSEPGHTVFTVWLPIEEHNE
ncbi:nitrogen regulation protein NR(II) [Nitrococcus mobilis]|uniref:histidine kinase n=1 Tax=Nitrococcus mobilis Nb-231 TaxID=314278 RepID=A4BTX2_9GAMM|nr:nitrogen regulation protein NR(II) [Nitrococcus mobilis]EAR20793.1 two-component sensor NtrB [Nitrococcus mobilis Nb-231]